uniref:flavin reductase family protein n=1 Tax=Cupriavidus yeoncheonensis TaxID=1462994 RepID=UPI003F498E26
MDDIHFYEPSRGHGLRHDPLAAIVGPRPIGWIATVDKVGVPNLAPYAFFNVFNYTPPVVAFSSVGYKDTVRNSQANGEFVWNLVTRPLAERMNATSAGVSPDIDEFGLAGLTPVPSRLVSVPRVKESPVSFECSVTKVMQLQNAGGGLLDTWMVLGEVVGVHIDRILVPDGIYDTVAAQPILRGGGAADYYEISRATLFQMHRPG